MDLQDKWCQPDSAMKFVYLAVQEASKKWTMPIRDSNWKQKLALKRFMIEFEDRLAEYV